MRHQNKSVLISLLVSFILTGAYAAQALSCYEFYVSGWTYCMMHDGNVFWTSGGTLKSGSVCIGGREGTLAWEQSLHGSCEPYNDDEILRQISRGVACSSGQHAYKQDGENYAAGTISDGSGVRTVGVYVGEGSIPRYTGKYVLNSEGNCIQYDLDNDGYISLVSSINEKYDCDDNNPSFHKGARDLPCNNIDEDCDGFDYKGTDKDHDGWFNITEKACNSDQTKWDTNDNNAAINPDVSEIPYNQINEDGQSSTPDDDLDYDGYLYKLERALSVSNNLCAFADCSVKSPNNYVADCDDDDANRPGAVFEEQHCQYGRVDCWNYESPQYQGCYAGAGNNNLGEPCEYCPYLQNCYVWFPVDGGEPQSQEVDKSSIRIVDPIPDIFSENFSTGVFSEQGCMDGVDNDCDNIIDFLDRADCGFMDRDNDHYAALNYNGADCCDTGSEQFLGCSPDSASSISPSSFDSDNGIDDNCNGKVDDFKDVDGDGLSDAFENCPGEDGIVDYNGCWYSVGFGHNNLDNWIVG